MCQSSDFGDTCQCDFQVYFVTLFLRLSPAAPTDVSFTFFRLSPRLCPFLVQAPSCPWSPSFLPTHAAPDPRLSYSVFLYRLEDSPKPPKLVFWFLCHVKNLTVQGALGGSVG